MQIEKRYYLLLLVDENGDTALLKWYNQVYIKDKLKEGDMYLFYGKVTATSTTRACVESCNIYNAVRCR